jgi:hypothetical protein
MKKTLLVSALVFVLLATTFMTFCCKALGIGSGTQSVVIPATGTAYVVTDVSTTDDPQGLRDQNFSTQDFIKIWYVNQAQATEQVISVGLLKFDLSSVKNKEIASATLQMYATRVDFTEGAIGRLVDVNQVDGTFDAATVTYNTRPAWGVSPIARSFIYGAGFWYSWDVSASVLQKAETGEVAYVTGLLTMEDKSEEQVLFASKNVSAAAPRLLVTYTSSSTSLVPWWIWVIGIVVIAIIAFFIGWAVTRRKAAQQ